MSAPRELVLGGARADESLDLFMPSVMKTVLRECIRGHA